MLLEIFGKRSPNESNAVPDTAAFNLSRWLAGYGSTDIQ